MSSSNCCFLTCVNLLWSPLPSGLNENFMRSQVGLSSSSIPAPHPTFQPHKGNQLHLFIFASFTYFLTFCASWMKLRAPRERDTIMTILLIKKNKTIQRINKKKKRTGHRTTDWFQIEKGVCQGCILSPCWFNLYAEYAEIKIAGRNINHLRYADDTTLMAESEEELKSHLMKVKEEIKKLA